MFKFPKYKIKQQSSDFIVREVFLCPDKTQKNNSAAYTYIIVQKDGITTFELLDRLAKIFNIDRLKVSASGLKDENAITTQIISVYKRLTVNDINKANKFLKNINVEFIYGYGNSRIKPKMLYGNVFDIVIRNLSDDVCNKIATSVLKNRYFSFINYYDEQRFGIPNKIHNTHLIGKYLLTKNWKNAYNEYIRSGNEGREKNSVKKFFKLTQSYKKSLYSIPEDKRNFFISSYNSYLWNEKLYFFIKKQDNISIVLLPYIDKKAFLKNNDVAIKSVISCNVKKLDWKTETIIQDIKTRPSIITTAIYCSGVKPDNLNKGKFSLALSFYLPTGCYATMLIKQIIHSSLI